MGHVRLSRQQHKDLLAIQARSRRQQRHYEVFGLDISNQATRFAPTADPRDPIPALPRQRTSSSRSKEPKRKVAATVKVAKPTKKGK
jgi:hypothetical protein